MSASSDRVSGGRRWLVPAAGLFVLASSFLPLAVAQFNPKAKTITFTVGVRPVLATPDLTCRVRDKNGKLVRSLARKNQFLRMIGRYPQPAGYVVDHLYSLQCGGCDLPSNMVLQTLAESKAKDRWESKVCGR